MIVSGIVLACQPDHSSGLHERIDALPWAQVRHTDPRGRLVVVIEAADTEESMARVKQLQALPDVLMAELGGYYLDEQPET
jgi:nitrate reductase NapAB chaperone NapD